jgi:hypothetical protein
MRNIKNGLLCKNDIIMMSNIPPFHNIEIIYKTFNDVFQDYTRLAIICGQFHLTPDIEVEERHRMIIIDLG